MTGVCKWCFVDTEERKKVRMMEKVGKHPSWNKHWAEFGYGVLTMGRKVILGRGKSFVEAWVGD